MHAAVSLALAALLAAPAAAAADVLTPAYEPFAGGFTRPHSIAATRDNVYVADFGTYHSPSDPDPILGDQHRHIWRFNATGGDQTLIAGLASGDPCQFAETGALCGDGAAATDARLGSPTGLAVDAAGRVYIAQGSWDEIRVVGTDGVIRTLTGLGLSNPQGLAYDATANTVLVADQNHDRIISFAADGATAATPTPVASGLHHPGAVAVGDDGTVYVADSHDVRVRKVAPGGAVSVFAGDGAICASQASPCGDGGPATAAQLGYDGDNGEGPFGIAVAPDGAVYIADSDVDRVRRVRPDGTIETIAQINHPKDLAVRPTATGNDVVVPEWEDQQVSLLAGVDSDPPVAPVVTPVVPDPVQTPPAGEPAPPPAAPAPPPAAKPALLRVGTRLVRHGRRVTIRYTLSARAALSLEIAPAKGRRVVLRFGTRRAAAGSVTWNGRLHGRRAAGRFTLRLVARAGGVVRRSRGYHVRL